MWCTLIGWKGRNAVGYMDISIQLFDVSKEKEISCPEMLLVFSEVKWWLSIVIWELWSEVVA